MEINLYNRMHCFKPYIRNQNKYNINQNNFVANKCTTNEIENNV